MLEFRDVQIGDKEVFEKYTRGYSNVEACFGNIFLWRKSWHIKIAHEKKALYVLMENGEYPSFMLPPFMQSDEMSIEEPLIACEEYMRSVYDKPIRFKGVTKETKQRIERDMPGEFVFVDDRPNYEYVYRSEDLANLVGKKYSGKRNHINKLINNHSFEYRAYTDEDYEKCIALQESWIVGKGGTNDDYDDELFVTKQALTNIDALGLKCGLLYVDGKMEAFSIGEKHGGNMAVVHIEKADPDLQGAFALINREFVRHEWSDVEYINREEDMGIEGMRRAKMSYNPIFLVEKYDCKRK